MFQVVIPSWLRESSIRILEVTEDSCPAGTPLRITADRPVILYAPAGLLDCRIYAAGEVCRLGGRCAVLLVPEESCQCLSRYGSAVPVELFWLEATKWPRPLPGTMPRMAEWDVEFPLSELFGRVKELRRRQDSLKDVLSGELLELTTRELWLYWLWAAVREEARPGNPRFGQMLDYLDRHLLERPGRRELALRFKMSPQQVNGLFRRELDSSPGEYVRMQLIRRAERLLRTERLSVKETADRLGFPNPFYFSRIFKKITGRTPSDS